MTLVFEEHVAGPSTHALVIGVGGYRHVADGPSPQDTVRQSVGLLQQLSSPPLSALDFASYLTDSRVRWRAPVASIDLLVSPLGPAPARFVRHHGHGSDVEAATMANIRCAYAGWRQRCSSDPASIAVFFFCGHGVEKSDHYLLAEDFGADPLNIWLGAFAFDLTRRAFHSCPATTQCFFVDACRSVTPGMLAYEPCAIPLDIPNIARSADCLHDLTIKAAARSEMAHGPKGKSSYFTQALLAGLSGGAAHPDADGTWQVGTEQLAAKINDLMTIASPSEGYPQRCIKTTSANAVLVRCDQPPPVQLTIVCDPSRAHDVAHLTCESVDEGLLHERPPAPCDWRLTTPAGYYRIGATFPAQQYRDSARTVFVEPPMTRGNVRCT